MTVCAGVCEVVGVHVSVWERVGKGRNVRARQERFGREGGWWVMVLGERGGVRGVLEKKRTPAMPSSILGFSGMRARRGGIRPKIKI